MLVDRRNRRGFFGATIAAHPAGEVRSFKVFVPRKNFTCRRFVKSHGLSRRVPRASSVSTTVRRCKRALLLNLHAAPNSRVEVVLIRDSTGWRRRRRILWIASFHVFLCEAPICRDLS